MGNLAGDKVELKKAQEIWKTKEIEHAEKSRDIMKKYFTN